MHGIAGATPIPQRFLVRPGAKLSLVAGPTSALGCCTGEAKKSPLQPHRVWNRGLAPFPLCPLTAIPFPSLERFRTGCSDAEKWHGRVSARILTMLPPRVLPGKDGGAEPGPGYATRPRFGCKLHISCNSS